MIGQWKARVPDVDIRWARREDAGAIARLFLVSSDGLAAYIWSRTDTSRASLEQIGAARYARAGTAFSYENALVAVTGGEIVGMVHAFEMEEPDPEAPGENDPVLRPYAELSDPGSLYVSGLAVDARHRHRGIGSELMDCAGELALAKALPRISLICFERNERALAFHQRRGFREVVRRPIVAHPSLRYQDGDALLLVRECGSLHPRGTEIAPSRPGTADTRYRQLE